MRSVLIMMLLRRAAGWTRVLGGAARPARPTLSRTFGDVARRSLVQGAEETVSGLDYAAEEGFEPPKVRLVGDAAPAEEPAEEQADEAESLRVLNHLYEEHMYALQSFTNK